MEFSKKSDFIVFGLSNLQTGEIIMGEGIFNVTIIPSYSYLTTDSQGVQVPNFVYDSLPG
jgi:hypothetical protein